MTVVEDGLLAYDDKGWLCC